MKICQCLATKVVRKGRVTYKVYARRGGDASFEELASGFGTSKAAYSWAKKFCQVNGYFYTESK